MKVDPKWASRDVYFENCFSLNPHTGKSTGFHAMFIVDHDGEIWPNPILDGPYKNVTAIPEGEPLSGYEERIRILAKYTDNPEEAHYKIFVEPFQF